ncbi:MAG: type II secretion system protein GspG [Planctomycetota bacterium]|nr:MAG: type II secretion system protein GspG [Planctomycetota bacterium]
MKRNWTELRRLQGGFSLVELMVVIAIIGLLSTIVAINVLGAREDANRQKVKADLKSIGDALLMYYNKVGRFPDSIEELVQPAEGRRSFITGGMDALKDPWGRTYVYMYDGAGDPPFLIGTYGSDGAPGGEGDAADIFNRDQTGGWR